MHVNLSWLKVEERLTSSLLVFVRSVDKLNAPSCLFKQPAHSSDTHTYPTRHATKDIFTIHKQARTDYGRHTVLHRAMTTSNSHQVTHASSKIWFKKQIQKHLMEQRGLWSYTNQPNIYIHTHTKTPSPGYCLFMAHSLQTQNIY